MLSYDWRFFRTRTTPDRRIESILDDMLLVKINTTFESKSLDSEPSIKYYSFEPRRKVGTPQVILDEKDKYLLDIIRNFNKNKIYNQELRTES